MPGIHLNGRSRAHLLIFLFALLLFAGDAFAQQKPKLRPLRIALTSHSVSSTAIYVARSLGNFESYGFAAFDNLERLKRFEQASVLTHAFHAALSRQTEVVLVRPSKAAERPNRE